MRPSILRVLAPILAVCSSLPLAAHASAGDVPGSHDHPIVSRFDGSVIVGYMHSDYGVAMLPLGRYSASGQAHFARSDKLEGKLTRIAYTAPAGKTALEVYRNFEQALAAAGFQTRFHCSGGDDCGGFDFSTAVNEPVLGSMRGNRNLMISTLEAASGNVWALTARLARPAGNVDVALLVGQNDDHPVGILLQVVEAAPMATGQVTVDAKAMSQASRKAGTSPCTASTSPATAPCRARIPTPRSRKWRSC
jgi:OmpA-OmpF porin, OOP family